MKFYATTETQLQGDVLQNEYKAGRQIGNISVGETCLYFKNRRKVYYVPYTDMTRCFRRVMMVPMKMCCGTGDMAVESLVICSEKGELAEILMPGERGAKAAIEELKEKAPHAEFTAPKKEKEGAKTS